ncbi:MAG: hypothetical protein JWN40_3610 [Phycisphaerales bacterium]|nr:hypothetical protein [Phycisphaerales bacterium]
MVSLLKVSVARRSPGYGKPFALESMEPRLLMSVGVTPHNHKTTIDGPSYKLTARPNVNITREPGNQAEQSIAIDPTHPSHLFEVSNVDVGDFLVGAVSTDAGKTWSTRHMATGADGLPAACCDPSAAFDARGNLFITYLSADFESIYVGLSTNGGRSFRLIQTYNDPNIDQPTVVTGPNSVWVVFRGSDGKVFAAGARVTAGLGKVGKFGPLEEIPGSATGNYADIAVGPRGQVLVTYQTDSDSDAATTIFANLDPDGLGPRGFGPAIPVTPTNVGGFDLIPAMGFRGIDAEAGLAWDRSGRPYTGRVYLVYTDEHPFASDDTDIFVRHSDDNGKTWSPPVRVNDDATRNSQFLPRIAIDQTTGNVAVTWHDSRNDLGKGGPGDTDGVPNDDAQFYASVSTDGGRTFLSNVRLSAGTSNAPDAQNSVGYGDYAGLDFYAGKFYPAWADNSNSTNDNPDGALQTLDVYTTQVTVSSIRSSERCFSRNNIEEERDEESVFQSGQARARRRRPSIELD